MELYVLVKRIGRTRSEINQLYTSYKLADDARESFIAQSPENKIPYCDKLEEVFGDIETDGFNTRQLWDISYVIRKVDTKNMKLKIREI